MTAITSRSAFSWSACLPGWQSAADVTSELEIHSFHNVGNGFLVMLWATVISCDFSEPPDPAPPPHGPAHIRTPTPRDLNLISRDFDSRLSCCSNRNRNIMFLGSRALLSVRRLSGQCGILNISQTYRPLRPVNEDNLSFFFTLFP
jgi:hypothetical protein